jgi:predicted phosphodiesterase
MGKGEIARKYRIKHGQEMPTKKLARILLKDHPFLFKDVEDARSALRRIENKGGGACIKDQTLLHSVCPDYVGKERPRNPYSLPKSDEREWLPYEIKGVPVLGVMSDIHIPYHSISAISCALDWFVSKGVNALLLNGDSIDCYKLSDFSKDGNKRNFSEELDCLKNTIEVFKKVLDCPIYFKLGNHEERYERFLAEKAGELIGVEEFTFESLIKKRVDVEIITDKRIIRANDLAIIHGHEIKGGISAPVNIARGLYNRGKVCAMQGHNHTTSEHTEPNLWGDITTTWSLGCLCDLHPEYMPINKWCHGAAIVELEQNGKGFLIENKRIRNGKIL